MSSFLSDPFLADPVGSIGKWTTRVPWLLIIETPDFTYTTGARKYLRADIGNPENKSKPVLSPYNSSIHITQDLSARPRMACLPIEFHLGRSPTQRIRPIPKFFPGKFRLLVSQYLSFVCLR